VRTNEAVSMGREHIPVPGKWYENLEDEDVFKVLSVNEDAELIEIQYDDGDVEEIDYETWHEMDLELSAEPEGWASRDEDEDEEDWDEDDDEEDEDWDDDDDDDDEEEDGDHKDY